MVGTLHAYVAQVDDVVTKYNGYAVEVSVAEGYDGGTSMELIWSLNPFGRKP
jgi:hypothetical protein